MSVWCYFTSLSSILHLTTGHWWLNILIDSQPSSDRGFFPQYFPQRANEVCSSTDQNQHHISPCHHCAENNPLSKKIWSQYSCRWTKQKAVKRKRTATDGLRSLIVHLPTKCTSLVELIDNISIKYMRQAGGPNELVSALFSHVVCGLERSLTYQTSTRK